MNGSVPYIAIAVGALAIIVILAVVTGRWKMQKKLTPLTGLAFAFVIAGIVFGESRLVGYGLMGVGVGLAILDMILRGRRAG